METYIVMSSHFHGEMDGVVVKLLDRDIVVSWFKLQSHFYIYFWIPTLMKYMNHLIFPAK